MMNESGESLRTPSYRRKRANHDLSALRYLIVDDSAFTRRLIHNVLNSFGATLIYEADDAAAAFQVLREQPIDLLLVDHEMPLLTGVELVRLVRRDTDVLNPQLPIIMISGHNDENSVREAKNSGIHEFLAKPFSAGQLRQRILHCLENPRTFVREGRYVGPELRPSKPQLARNDRNPIPVGSG